MTTKELFVPTLDIDNVSFIGWSLIKNFYLKKITWLTLFDKY